MTYKPRSPFFRPLHYAGEDGSYVSNDLKLPQDQGDSKGVAARGLGLNIVVLGLGLRVLGFLGFRV